MSGWTLWVLAACAFAVGEMLTRGLLLAPLAAGALLAALIGVIGVGALASWIAFLIISLPGLAIGRRTTVRRRRRRAEAELRTGAAALIGRHGLVLERIVNDEGVGCIRVGREVWTARAFDGHHVIEQGTEVEIVDARGATALVVQ